MEQGQVSWQTLLQQPEALLALAMALVGALWALSRLAAAWERMRFRKDGIPQVGGGWPVLGVALRMISGAPWDLMSQWAREYGPIYKFYLFGQWCVSVAAPEGLKEVMQTKLGAFEKDLDWTYRPFLCLLGTGIVTSKGKLWLRQRALISKPFKLDILTVIPRIAMEATERLARRILAAEGSPEPLEMGEEFRRLTLQVIAEAILSLSPTESDQTFAQMYLPIVTEGNLRTWYPHREYSLFSPAWYTHAANVRHLNQYMADIVRRRRDLLRAEGAFAATPQTLRRRDLLDKIIGAIPEDEWSEQHVRQLRDELKTFMLAGHETSASMLTWALFELTQNPACLEEVRREAEALYGQHSAGDIGTWAKDFQQWGAAETLRGLSYTEAALRETLRKYSVVPTVSRVCTKDTEVMGKKIHKGTVMMLMIKAVHEDPAIWPEPYAFRPERFYVWPEKDGGASAQPEVRPFTFVPFIQGPRNCLGQYLSLLESKIVLSSLVHFFDWSCEDPSTCGELHQFMLPVIPKVGMFLSAKPRR